MLPLSMVVTRIMIIEAASGLYGVPMDLIAETVRVEREHIHRIQQAEAFILRDRLIPLVRLADVLRESARPLKHDARSRAGLPDQRPDDRCRHRRFPRRHGCDRQAVRGHSRGRARIFRNDAARRRPRAADPRSEGVDLMGLRFDNKVARFEGHCTVEEALPLVQFLGETEGATVALDACQVDARRAVPDPDGASAQDRRHAEGRAAGQRSETPLWAGFGEL